MQTFLNNVRVLYVKQKYVSSFFPRSKLYLHMLPLLEIVNVLTKGKSSIK